MELFTTGDTDAFGSQSAREYCFYNKVYQFFHDDPDIDVGEVSVDDETHKLIAVITVHDGRKADILRHMLKVPLYAPNLQFVIECDNESTYSDADLAYLLKSNPYFSYYRSVPLAKTYDENSTSFKNHILMKPVVVQYCDDDSNNPWGIQTMTAEDIAKQLFIGNCCHITTDVTYTDVVEP